MKAIHLLAIAALGAALTSCAAWREVTVTRTAEPVATERSSVRSDATAASYAAERSREERRASLGEGGGGGPGGTPR